MLDKRAVDALHFATAFLTRNFMQYQQMQNQVQRDSCFLQACDGLIAMHRTTQFK